MLGWSPDTFWKATFYEVSCAYIGYCQANGVGRWGTNAAGWTPEMMDEHRSAVKDLMEKYPDGTRKELKRLKAEKGNQP